MRRIHSWRSRTRATQVSQLFLYSSPGRLASLHLTLVGDVSLWLGNGDYGKTRVIRGEANNSCGQIHHARNVVQVRAGAGAGSARLPGGHGRRTAWPPGAAGVSGAIPTTIPAAVPATVPSPTVRSPGTSTFTKARSFICSVGTFVDVWRPDGSFAVQFASPTCDGAPRKQVGHLKDNMRLQLPRLCPVMHHRTALGCRDRTGSGNGYRSSARQQRGQQSRSHVELIVNNNQRDNEQCCIRPDGRGLSRRWMLRRPGQRR